MPERFHGKSIIHLLAFLGLCLGLSGCRTCPTCPTPSDASVSPDIKPEPNAPRELKKVTLPAYVIEAPDILLIDAVSIVPKPPFRISPLDSYLIQATPSLPNTPPIGGPFTVEPDGTISLGINYGSVRVAGLTLAEAKAAIEEHLAQFVNEPKANIVLLQSQGIQQIRGEHLVTQDGTVNMGIYGEVMVAGLTIPEAKRAIDQQLSNYLLNPSVAVRISGFNSKVYYIVLEGGGYGQTLHRLPITGNETVLDAIAQIGGLPAQASLKDIWVARPAPEEKGCDQILPVDWYAITDKGCPATNYQLLPGDRLHVRADTLITLDNSLAKFIAPIERVFGITLLGTNVVNSIKSVNNKQNAQGQQ